MANWKPLVFMLLIMAVIGGITYLLLTAFEIDTSMPNPDNPLSYGFLYNLSITYVNASFVDLIPTGYVIFDIFGAGGFELKVPIVNFFALFGDSTQEFMISFLNMQTYIPIWLYISLIVLFIGALIWTGVKLFMPGG